MGKSAKVASTDVEDVGVGPGLGQSPKSFGRKSFILRHPQPFRDDPYSLGNAPAITDLFDAPTGVRVIYLAGTSGWGPTFGGSPTAVWKPVIKATGIDFGIKAGRFGFDTGWANKRQVVVEACSDMAQPVWIPVATNTLTDGWVQFTDPEWKSQPARFYRVRGK